MYMYFKAHLLNQFSFAQNRKSCLEECTWKFGIMMGINRPSLFRSENKFLPLEPNQIRIFKLMCLHTFLFWSAHNSKYLCQCKHSFCAFNSVSKFFSKEKKFELVKLTSIIAAKVASCYTEIYSTEINFKWYSRALLNFKPRLTQT